MEKNNQWFKDNLLGRFLRYTAIDTMSDPDQTKKPTTQGQWELADLLIAELKNLGITDIYRDVNGFVIASVPPRHCTHQKVIGLMAHLDTSPEVSGKNVAARVHADYDGSILELGNGYVLDPGQFPDLGAYKGDTIITTDGSTLLGADDKAGVTEIMSALEYLSLHEDIGHPGLEVIFTTDEETGRGMNQFPVSRLKSVFCYTVDGGDEGFIESENFEAYKVLVKLAGKSFHLGKAKGKMINSIQLATQMLSLFPAVEKPETTDAREGYYCPIEIKGTIESSQIQILIRDFSETECIRRIGNIERLAGVMETLYPGAKIAVTSEKQYANMGRFLKQDDPGLQLLEKAIRMTGREPVYTSIRGGTDGSRLSEMGIPTPNIFTGGHNFHSRFEWIPLSAMVRAAHTIVNLVELWAAETV